MKKVLAVIVGILAFVVIFLASPKPVSASTYTCSINIEAPFPDTVESLFKELSDHCQDFPYGYTKYGVIVYQEIGQEGKKIPIVSIENSDLMGVFVPPIKLFYANDKRPLEVHIGPRSIASEALFPFRITTDASSIVFNDVCSYTKIYLGSDNSHWISRSENKFFTKEWCASLIGK